MPPNDDQPRIEKVHADLVANASHEESLPESLLWRREWVYDPIPEWWKQRMDKEDLKEIVAIQTQTRIRILTLQQEALKAQVDALKKAGEIVAR